MRRSPRQRYPYFPGDPDPFINPLPRFVQPQEFASAAVLRDETPELFSVSDSGVPQRVEMRPSSEYIDNNGHFDGTRVVQDDWAALLNSRIGRGIPLEPGSTVAERWAALRPEARFTSPDSLGTYFEKLPSFKEPQTTSEAATEKRRYPTADDFLGDITSSPIVLEWAARAAGSLIPVLPQVMGFPSYADIQRDPIGAGAQLGSITASSLLRFPGPRPPMAAAASNSLWRIAKPVAPPPFAELILERSKGQKPDEEALSRDPSTYSTLLRNWLDFVIARNQPILHLFNDAHELARRRFEPGRATIRDVYDLNSATEDARGLAEAEREFPGHHWFMTKFGNDFASIGMTRPWRDLLRTFEERAIHDYGLHRDLIEHTEDLFRRPVDELTFDNALEHMLGLVDRRGLWVPRWVP
jgi:hypothetical protein